MTKAEIIKNVKERTGLSHQQSRKVVEIFLEGIKESLHKGERVCLVGLGSFYLKKRKERKGRNPKTGENLLIPEKWVVGFKAGREFREMAKTRENVEM